VLDCEEEVLEEVVLDWEELVLETLVVLVPIVDGPAPR
jgi:hypothetical protein